jgi:hypothetical protein
MTVRDRVIALLQQHAGGLDDDEVAAQLGLSRREHANAVCRGLESAGLIHRAAVDGKLRNMLLASTQTPPPPPAARFSIPSPGPTLKPWCWEGNVVTAVTRYLVDQGWTIDSVADTATGEPGSDIVAHRTTEVLVVEAKGYPSKTYENGPRAGQPKPTNPTTQARHWVGEALLTALLRQTETKATRVALAFPDFPVYLKLLKRLGGALGKLQLEILIVQESGTVNVLRTS